MRYERNASRELPARRPGQAPSVNRSYVVQNLVPKETGKGEPVSKEWFDKFLQN